MTNESLQHHLDSEAARQAMSSAVRVKIMADVTAGLAYLHEQVRASGDEQLQSCQCTHNPTGITHTL
jgi:hypothetical protein